MADKVHTKRGVPFGSSLLPEKEGRDIDIAVEYRLRIEVSLRLSIMPWLPCQTVPYRRSPNLNSRVLPPSFTISIIVNVVG